MRTGMVTESTEMVTDTTMGGVMVTNITEARPAAITAKMATTIAGITNRRCFFLTLYVTVALAHRPQATIEGPAYLRGISDAFDFWPDGATAFPEYFVDFPLAKVGECSSQVGQVPFRVDGDIATVGLPRHCVCLLDNGAQARHFEMLVNQLK